MEDEHSPNLPKTGVDGDLHLLGSVTTQFANTRDSQVPNYGGKLILPRFSESELNLTRPVSIKETE